MSVARAIVSAVPEDIPEIPMAKAQASIFDKTKICKFYTAGFCNRGSVCRFAHGKVDLHPVPDLSHTKMCPDVVNNGSCNDASCRFAHSKEQLRKRAFIFTNEGVINNPSPYIPNKLDVQECSVTDAAQELKTRRKGKSQTLDLGAIHRNKVPHCINKVVSVSLDNYDAEKNKDTEKGLCVLNVPESLFSRQTTAADGGDYFDDGLSTCPWTRQISTESCTQDEIMGPGNCDSSQLDLMQRLDLLDQSSETGVGSEETGSTCGLSSMDEQRPITGESALQDGAHAMFHKTKICKFYLAGMCDRASQCKYAHGQAELLPLPNLAQTKLCPTVKKDMECLDPNCKFAHSREELRHANLVALQNEVAGDQFQTPDTDKGSNEDVSSSQDLECSEDVSAVELPSVPRACLVPTLTPQRLEVQDRPASMDTGAKVRPTTAEVFRKTKICKFHAMGLCSRGEACRYAHAADDLQPLPDLTCTKICPTLLRAGSCQDLGCKYAHSRCELKTYKEGSKFNSSPPRIVSEDATPSISPKILEQMQWLDQLVSEGIIKVKNTFISVDSNSGQLRRAASAPAFD